MRLAICDDDMRVLAALEKMIVRPESSDTELFVYQSAEKLLAACADIEFDMIFMDIMLGEANGIEIAEKVSKLIPGIRIVFITAHVLDFAEKIFSGVLPYGYIGKPIDSAKVSFYLERAGRELESDGHVLRVSRRGVNYRLLQSGVRYIESSGRQAFIHYGDEIMGVYERLDTICQQLDDRFVRCHQSFIVNLDYVTSMGTDTFVVSDRTDGDNADGVPIRISRNHLREARQKYFEHKGRTLI
ncbi:MAG: response regulator transcription factor [Ruminococcaceae bacterium]|nr:response regulator transcription factor [Oscillospiraceae bacterium]